MINLASSVAQTLTPLNGFQKIGSGNASGADVQGASARQAKSGQSQQPQNVEKSANSAKAGNEQRPSTEGTSKSEASPSSSSQQAAAQAPTQASVAASANELTPEEQKIVDDLKARDQEVRAHEQAHATIGGPYAGSPQYVFEEGPDGREYAVSGEVAIDVSPIAGNPDATIRKMDIVIRAALAPAEPSNQDRAVAQTAQQQRIQAQIEKRELEKQKQEEESGGSGLLASLKAAEGYAKAEATSPLGSSDPAIQTQRQNAEEANAKLLEAAINILI